MLTTDACMHAYAARNDASGDASVAHREHTRIRHEVDFLCWRRRAGVSHLVSVCLHGVSVHTVALAVVLVARSLFILFAKVPG